MKQKLAALKIVLFLIALHSIIVGIALLVFPVKILSLVKLPLPEFLFFPNQTGIFHIVLAMAYLLAILDLPRSQLLLSYVVLVKGTAFLFLMIHWLLFSAPLIVGIMGLGDGLMGLVLYLLIRRAYGKGVWQIIFSA